MRNQFLNRNYETEYDNDTYRFIKALNPGGMIKETAEKLGFTYVGLYYNYRRDRISYNLKNKIEKNFDLSPEQKAELNRLVCK